MCMWFHYLSMFSCVDMQTILSAVLVLGPRSAVFLKPVVVSFHHCASVRHGQWSLALYGSDSPVHRPPHWQVRTRTDTGTQLVVGLNPQYGNNHRYNAAMAVSYR